MKTILHLLTEDSLAWQKVALTNGGEYSSSCPACGGVDRFRSWPDKPKYQARGGYFWCRQCGRKGDAIQYLRDFREMPYKEALQYLSLEPLTRIGAKGIDNTHTLWTPKEVLPPSSTWQGRTKAFVKWTREMLFKSGGEPVRDYLASRGIDEETMVRTKLGFNPEDFWREKPSWGLGTGKLWFPPGLVIPCFRNQTLMGIRIRKLDCAPSRALSKYMVFPGSVQVPTIYGWNENTIYYAQSVLVVESELDAAVIYQEVLDLVIPIGLGTVTCRPDLFVTQLLKDKTLFLALDNDDAGIRGVTWWKEHFPKAEVFFYQGKDPGQAFHNGLDVREWILKS